MLKTMWKMPLPFVLLFVTIGTVAGFLAGSDRNDRHSEEQRAAVPTTFGTGRPDPRAAAMVKDFERVATDICGTRILCADRHACTTWLPD